MRGKREEKERFRTFKVFVFGGSRGARTINEGVLDLLPYLENGRAGRSFTRRASDDFDHVAAGYKGSSTTHEVFAFTDQMEKYYNLADIVISRAGASTIFELSYFRRPAIFYPIPYAAGGHQWKNAAYVEAIGGGYDHREQRGLREKLYSAVAKLRENPAR